jgi:hypothetical protein
LEEKHLVKNQLISNRRQGNLGTSKEPFYRGLENFSTYTSQNRVEISRKKFSLFSNMFLLCSEAPRISMVFTSKF